MTVEGNTSNEFKPLADNERFTLVVHIGAAKTGTSSIQISLRRHQAELKKQGFHYLGQMLEHAPRKIFPWQVVSGTEEFLHLEQNSAQEQLSQVLSDSIQDLQQAGCHTAIWSNESFFGRSGVVIEALSSLLKAGIDVSVIAYVRRYDEWTRSAYLQWGLKHRIYRGQLKNFRQWLDYRQSGFMQHLAPWLENFEEKLLLRNMDTAGDSAADFLKLVGIDPSQFVLERRNESPSAEELVLRVLYNEQFDGKVQPIKFIRSFSGRKIQYNRPIESILAELLPTKEDLDQVNEQCSEDRQNVNALLEKCRQPPILDTPLAEKETTVDVSKIVTALAEIMIHQSRKLEELNTKVDSLQKDKDAQEQVNYKQEYQDHTLAEPQLKSDQNPVFVISTGRSGSTLIQRLLNCHPDLVVWGEHFGFINGLANAWNQIRNSSTVAFPKTAEENNAALKVLPTLTDPQAALEWVNPWSLEEFEAKVTSFLSNYFGSRMEKGQRWGFKEIRYNNMPALQMLRRIYPNGRFVFIKRDPIEVTRSKVFAFIKENKWAEFSEDEKRRKLEMMLKEEYSQYRLFDTFLTRNMGIGVLLQFESLTSSMSAEMTTVLNHLQLDVKRYDWEMANKVIGHTITSTKRDETLVQFIREVDAAIHPD